MLSTIAKHPFVFGSIVGSIEVTFLSTEYIKLIGVREECAYKNSLDELALTNQREQRTHDASEAREQRAHEIAIINILKKR